MRRPALALLALPVALLAGCGHANSGTVTDGTSAAASAAHVITVTSTDTGCDVSSSTSAPGTLAFEVTNRGTAATTFQVLVFQHGQQTVGLAPGIPVGATRTLSIREMVPGDYITVCRPSATGKDLQADFEVSRSAS